MKTALTAKPYEWDFDGSCVPDGPQSFSGQETFSVGIFQWIPTKSGTSLKRGKVVKRIRGHVSEKHKVIADARNECFRRNKGEQNEI